MPTPERAQAETPGGEHTLPGQSGPRSVFLIRYAGVRSRTDCPSVAELLADDWRVEAVDERYGTSLMRKDLNE